MDRTFPWRLAAGLCVLGWLIVRDLRKPIRSYVRLKEYGFLFGTAALAIGYGMVHDRITYAISREYYVIGKGLASAANGFNSDVAMMAAQASWSAGLFVGLMFLIANRRQQRVGQLPYRTLMTLLVIPLLGSIATACALGAIGFFLAAPLSADFELHYLGLRAPALFCATWGVHTGTYLGALGGVLASYFRIRRLRSEALRLRRAARALSGSGAGGVLGRRHRTNTRCHRRATLQMP